MKKLTVLLISLLLMGLAGSTSALSIAAADKYVIVAGGPSSFGWTTDLKFVYDSPLTITAGLTTFTFPNETVQLSSCFPQPLSELTVKPGDVKFVSAAEGYQCGQPYSVLKLTLAITQVKSLLTFKNGSEFGYLVVPGLDPVLTQTGSVAHLIGLASKGDTHTDIVTYNTVSAPVALKLKIGDDNYFITSYPGINIYRVPVDFVGNADLVEVGGGPDNKALVLGFVANGKSGAPEVILFKP